MKNLIKRGILVLQIGSLGDGLLSTTCKITIAIKSQSQEREDAFPLDKNEYIRILVDTVVFW